LKQVFSPAVEEILSIKLGPNRIPVRLYCDCCLEDKVHIIAKTPITGGTDTVCTKCGDFKHYSCHMIELFAESKFHQ
jgi:hypothetical protein